MSTLQQNLVRQARTANRVATLTSNTTLTTSNIADTELFLLNHATGFTVSLPSLATWPVGRNLKFFNYNVGPVVFSYFGSDSGFVSGSETPSSITLRSGESLTLESRGDYWFVVDSLRSRMSLMAAKATTSGTSVDFSPTDNTGVPAWAKKITVLFNNISTNGTSIPQVQIGSGSIKTTGYLSVVTCNATNTTSTTGFAAAYAMAATYALMGKLEINLASGFDYVVSGPVGLVSSGSSLNSASATGLVTLTGLVDRIRLTTINGTDTFDAGSVSVLYEG